MVGLFRLLYKRTGLPSFQGKFWHRHRRPRPVEYNSDAEYHRNLIREAEQARVAAKRKRPQPSAVDEQPTQTPAEDGDVEPETPTRPKTEVWVEVPPNPQSSSHDTDRPMSPVSSASSASESPLAHRVSRSNGAGHSKSAPPDPVPQEPEPDDRSTVVAPPAGSPPPPRPSAPPHAHQHAVCRFNVQLNIDLLTRLNCRRPFLNG